MIVLFLEEEKEKRGRKRKKKEENAELEDGDKKRQKTVFERRNIRYVLIGRIHSKCLSTFKQCLFVAFIEKSRSRVSTQKRFARSRKNWKGRRGLRKNWSDSRHHNCKPCLMKVSVWCDVILCDDVMQNVGFIILLLFGLFCRFGSKWFTDDTWANSCTEAQEERR